MKSSFIRNASMSAILLPFLVGCGGGGGGDSPSAPTSPAVGASAFAGNYKVSGGDVAINFSISPEGLISACTSATLVACKGTVAADGKFTITGDDGKLPVATTATLTGSIGVDGSITGSYLGSSISEGPFSGAFVGGKAPTPTPTPTPTIAAFAGQYAISGGGQTITFSLNSTGKVSACSSGAFIVCNGSVTSNGTLLIVGNDGAQPVDTEAELKGTITGDGLVTGTFSSKSKTDGSTSGPFSGRRISALSPT